MLRIMMVVVLALAACGCTASKKIYRPDGSEGYLIDCSGQPFSSCLEKAGQACKERGYIVLGQENEKYAQASSKGPEAASAPSANQTLFIRCK